MSMSNLSFSDNGRMYQIFIYVPNIKKKKIKIKTLKPGKLWKKTHHP